MGCLKVKGDNFYKKLGEPTTHLDYVTIALLEKTLQEFNGTIILVMHDKFLRDRVSEREIYITKG